jgi:hypothetical protein
MFRIEDQTEMNTLFNGFLDMMFLMKVIDDGSRFQYSAANDSALNYAGISREVIGKYMDEVLEEELAAELQIVYEKTVSLQKPVQVQTETIRNGKLQTSVT